MLSSSDYNDIPNQLLVGKCGAQVVNGSQVASYQSIQSWSDATFYRGTNQSSDSVFEACIKSLFSTDSAINIGIIVAVSVMFALAATIGIVHFATRKKCTKPSCPSVSFPRLFHHSQTNADAPNSGEQKEEKQPTV